MRLTPLKIFAVVALFSTVGAVSAARAGGDTTLHDISRYRDWARVADVPVPVKLAAPAG